MPRWEFYALQQQQNSASPRPQLTTHRSRQQKHVAGDTPRTTRRMLSLGVPYVDRGRPGAGFVVAQTVSTDRRVRDASMVPHVTAEL